jgi:hypothetical protein
MPNTTDANTNQEWAEKKKVTYHPPEPVLIDQFANRVCHAMAERGDDRVLDPEVVNGFSSFIKLIARVKSKELNGEIGKPIDKGEQER